MRNALSTPLWRRRENDGDEKDGDEGDKEGSVDVSAWRTRLEDHLKRKHYPAFSAVEYLGTGHMATLGELYIHSSRADLVREVEQDIRNSQKRSGGNKDSGGSASSSMSSLDCLDLNLMLDVLFSFLALYFVDVVGVSDELAGIAILTWTGVGLIGDFLLIPLLERVPGLTYLRVSVVAELLLYPAFLLVDDLLPKLVILGVIGLFNAGWYSILSGRLYSTLPGQSGVALTVGNVAGLFGSLIRPAIGVVATAIGLQNAMWLVLLGPIALLIGLPRKLPSSEADE